MIENRETPTARRLLRAGAAAAIAALVAGCSSGTAEVRDALGISLKSPDAFNVYPRRPLQMPPDMAELPPPNPGAPSPRDPAPTREAQAALGNAGAPTETAAAAPARRGAGPSAGEQALIASAGAAQADPNIRYELETAEDDGDSPFGLSTLFGYAVPDYNVREGGQAPTLQSREEADRIQAEGGVTPNAPPPPPESPGGEWVLGDLF